MRRGGPDEARRSARGEIQQRSPLAPARAGARDRERGHREGERRDALSFFLGARGPLHHTVEKMLKPYGVSALAPGYANAPHPNPLPAALRYAGRGGRTSAGAYPYGV